MEKIESYEKDDLQGNHNILLKLMLMDHNEFSVCPQSTTYVIVFRVTANDICLFLVKISQTSAQTCKLLVSKKIGFQYNNLRHGI